MTQFFLDSAKAVKRAGLPDLSAAARLAEAAFPFLTNDYYLSLIERTAADITADPIYMQSFPAAAELLDSESDFDPLAEAEQMLCPRMIRRFQDRVVVLVTNKCAMHCRFCFRKRLWKQGAELPDLSDDELQTMVETLKQTPEIHEVLLSGGDAAMLPTARLQNIIQAFSDLPQISVIRLASRLPVVWPARFDAPLIEMLSRFDKLWLLTHFNHPVEVTAQAAAVCRSLVKHGIPVLNQTVLLKGVNDQPEILEELFRKLLAIKVKAHYLFHVDPVRGVRHFATGIAAGLEVLKYLRGRLSSLGTPTFALDLPEGGGKVALQPDYSNDGKFWDIHNKKLIEYGDKELKK